MACLGPLRTLWVPLWIFLLPTEVIDCQNVTPFAVTSVGVFEGEQDTSPPEGNHKYFVFKGIPFAKPPVGELRWKLPEPFGNVDSVYNATRYKAACPQVTYYLTSEDCLYLDLYLPGGTKGLYYNRSQALGADADSQSQVSGDELLPVMIWVHGGAYTNGYSAQYPGVKITTEQNVIVAVIQYRLSYLGFLSSGDDALPGNYGLWDQRLAMMWVKDNIRGFGGDPTKVTISGESAGASSVSQHSISRQSSGIFQNVVMMSGAPGASWSHSKNPEAAFVAFANVTGCGGPGHTTTKERVSCLRNKPLAELAEAATLSQRILQNVNPFLPVVDGHFFTDTVENLLKDEDYLTSIGFSEYKFLNGVVNNEGAIMASVMAALIPSLLATKAVSTNLLDNIILDYIVESQLDDYSADVKDVVNFHYFYPRDAATSSSIPINKVWDAFTDTMFVVPAVKFARRYSENSAPSSSNFQSPATYMYLFDWYPSLTAGTAFEGVYHGMDVYYLFGFIDAAKSVYGVYELNGTFELADNQISRLFGDMIGAFVRTGDPNSRLPDEVKGKFRPYDATNETYLRITLPPSVENHMYAKRVSLWTDLVPRLHSRWLQEHSTPTPTTPETTTAKTDEPSPTTPRTTTDKTEEPTFSKFSLTETEVDSAITALITVCVILACACVLAVVYMVVQHKRGTLYTGLDDRKLRHDSDHISTSMSTTTVTPTSSVYGTFTPESTAPTPTHQNGTHDHVPLIDEQEEKESTCQMYTSCRWTLTYFGFLLNMLLFCLRNCISMALVCIDDVQGLQETFPPVSNDTYGPGKGTENDSMNSANISKDFVENVNGTIPEGVPMYIPDEMQGLMLSSYYYGYMFTPYAAGMLAERVGGKIVLTVTMAMAATFTLLTPLMIRLSVYLAVTFRFLVGMCSGVAIPALMSMWTDWAPPNEKARLVAYSASGNNIGTIMATMVSGFLCSIPVDEGWPFIFYVYGGMALAWSILWQILIHNKPDCHPRISRTELRLLTKHKSYQQNSRRKASRLPLKSVATSVPFLALQFCNTCDAWLYCTIGTYVPLYCSQLLHFDTQTSGILSSLPFMSALLCTWMFAALADRLHVGGLLSVTNNRKLFQAIGGMIPGALFIGLMFVGEETRGLAVGILVVINGFLSAGLNGAILNRLDLAPRFAGSLSGIAITIGNLAQIVCPLIVSDIISDNKPESWSEVFFITAIIAFVGVIVFCIFGSGKEQEWAKEKLPTVTYSTDGDARGNG